ncbi:MAG: deoxyribose-phosphate aldolase [Propionibacteriaceae bacterium]|nr:deoxyribose-phosphate aldolase [Propionibacteriaceae bacterium]
MTMDRTRLARMIDHTLLRPEATTADVEVLIKQGIELGAYSICVSPSMLPVKAPGLHVAAVCGFPSGAHTSQVKAAEAIQAVADGADEIDMVINLGLAKAGDWDLVAVDIDEVRQAVPHPVVLKAIIESALLSDEEIVLACRAAQDGGADFVKTSTGFHPAGGASVHAVRLMKDTVGHDIQVKASGGIRTLEGALALIEAGATRLGTSSTAAILAGLG